MLTARSVSRGLPGDVGRGFWDARVAALGSRTFRPFALRDFRSLQARVCQIRLHRRKPHKAGASFPFGFSSRVPPFRLFWLGLI